MLHKVSMLVTRKSDQLLTPLFCEAIHKSKQQNYTHPEVFFMASSKQVVGNPTPRVEGELKVSGHAKYAGDITLPGMLWGKLLRSPIASGKIKRIDTSKAEALPGVYAVITGQDCTGLKIGRRLYDMPILADGEVRFIGEKVAAVAADNEDLAEEALDLIEVEYEETEPLLDPVEALKPSAKLVHPEVVNYKGLP